MAVHRIGSVAADGDDRSFTTVRGQATAGQAIATRASDDSCAAGVGPSDTAGRGERNFQTWQGRLPQELRLRGIRTLEQANAFLRQSYIQEFNRKFAVKSAQPGTAFLPARRRDLDQVFSLQHERVVNRDNTVSWATRSLQIEKTSWRGTLAGCRVIVCSPGSRYAAPLTAVAPPPVN